MPLGNMVRGQASETRTGAVLFEQEEDANPQVVSQCSTPAPFEGDGAFFLGNLWTRDEDRWLGNSQLSSSNFSSRIQSPEGGDKNRTYFIESL